MTSAGYVRFDWERYINLAEELWLSIPEEDEAKARAGISRAYYGAFHAAKDYLLLIGITLPVYGKGSHDEVIRNYIDFGKVNKLWAGIGDELKNLKNQRIKADYNDRYFMLNERRNMSLKSQLLDAIEKARYIVRRIEELKAKEG